MVDPAPGRGVRGKGGGIFMHVISELDLELRLRVIDISIKNSVIVVRSWSFVMIKLCIIIYLFD